MGARAKETDLDRTGHSPRRSLRSGLQRSRDESDPNVHRPNRRWTIFLARPIEKLPRKAANRKPGRRRNGSGGTIGIWRNTDCATERWSMAGRLARLRQWRHFVRPAPGMTMRQLLVLLMICAATPCLALDHAVKPCGDAGVDLRTLMTPVAKNSISLYDGKVAVYNVDTIEPACCSSGIAVVLPDVNDQLGGNTCMALIGYTSIDVTKAKRSYDAARGMLLELPTQTRTDEGQPGSLVTTKLRINLATSNVTLEP